MRLISRYLVRQLWAPFCFALAALTGFMLLNQVAKKFGQLVGKGLDWSVIAEVFALSLPFIVAMTLPMAVLVAVLYTFSHLAADNEVTAMRASGLSIWQILRPVLVWGLVLGLVNLAFVDQVLPRSNAQLRALLIEINRKKPTFQLREQVINEVPPSDYFLRALRIDPGSGRLRGVTIYDIGNPQSRRVIYADSGLMAYAPGGQDLTLRLWHGTVHAFQGRDPQSFDLTTFGENQIRVRNVFDRLERSENDVIRGDREMSSCEMLTVVREAERDAVQARRERRVQELSDLRRLLGLPPLPPAPQAPVPPARGYCAWLARLRTWVLPGTAQAQQGAQQAGRRAGGRAGGGPVRGAPPVRGVTLPPSRRPAVPPSPAAAPGGAPPVYLTSWTELQGMRDRADDAERRADRYAVEVHKKWSISAACLTFVLVGVALALRFPRAGMGLVLGGGMAVFAIFYVGLTAGESLADRNLISPAVAMWWPNVLLGVLGLAGLWWVNRESGSTRGGDFAEIWEGIRTRLPRRLRRGGAAGRRDGGRVAA
ncbi:MAG TPA: LptF/LptG family permease [Gemmatimonadales bacterium]|nr:LptF/LptG family permease [Gemmatimonadales bacterium]